jgi:hypothetical protein
MASGLDIPDDIAPLVAKSGVQGSKKAAGLTFTLQQQKRDKDIERRSIKRLGKDDADPEVPPKLTIQFYRNETTSRLKEHYGTFLFC